MSILAQQYPIFRPVMRIITNITNDIAAHVTTSFNHNYITGLIVRIVMPQGYGMQEINQLFGSIVVTGDTTFTIAIDTTSFSPFSTPITQLQYPQSIPFGEDNETLYGAYRNILRG